MGRIRGLKKIKTPDEYNEIKEELKNCVDEYVALNGNPNARDDIKKEAEETMLKLNSEMSNDEKTVLLEKLHVLEVKYTGLKDGSYLASLKNNIRAHLIRIEQYEAEMEDMNLWKISLGLIKNSSQVKNYLRKRFMISNANRYGVAPAAVDLKLESPRNIMEYMINSKRYNFVGIKKEDLALIPVEESSNVKAFEASKHFNEITETFIKEVSSDVKDNEKENTTKATMTHKRNSINVKDKSRDTERDR